MPSSPINMRCLADYLSKAESRRRKQVDRSPTEDPTISALGINWSELTKNRFIMVPLYAREPAALQANKEHRIIHSDIKTECVSPCSESAKLWAVESEIKKKRHRIHSECGLNNPKCGQCPEMNFPSKSSHPRKILLSISI
jgi:hypothetical protein